MTPTRPGITHIGQIALHVADIGRATEFYRDVLGLEHLFSAPPALAFFRCGEVRLMFAEPEESAAEPEVSGAVIYYAVPDVRAAHASLLDAGAECVSDPHVVHRTESTELWMAFFKDPDGHLFATMCESASA